MQSDFNNMQVGDYVMIVTSIEFEDNAKLYSRTETEWVFITDFSGAQGIQGEQGPQGIQGIQGEKGTGISSLEVRDGSLYVTLTDNTQQNAGLIITDEVKQWIINEVTNNAQSKFNTYYNEKVTDFDEHAETKINEYNQNAESLINRMAELETENKILKNQIPKGQVEGNTIHLTDSSDMEMDWKIKGGHRQEKREGYNLFKNIYSNITQNGVTLKVNNDGTITLNGTDTSVNAYNDFNLIEMFEYTGTKIASVSVISGSATKLTEWQLTDKNWENTLFMGITNNVNPRSLKFKEGITYTNSTLRIEKGCVCNNLTIGLQIENGIEARPYEQYGASPSPEYPSEIETVGSNVNFFNKDQVLQGSAIDKTVKNKNGIFLKEVKKGEKYTCQIFNSNLDYAIAITAVNIQTPTTNIFQDSGWLSGAKHTITCNSDGYLYMGICKRGNAVISPSEIKATDFKVERGEIATPWSPYGMGSVEIDVVNDDNTKSQTAIMPVQQEMLEGDYIEDVEHHEWGKKIFDGTETVVGYNTGNINKTAAFQINLSDSLNTTYNQKQMLTNMFNFNSTWGSDNECYNNSDKNFIVRLNVERLTGGATVNGFKAWLKSKYDEGNPVIVYYKLATPVNLELTSEQKAVREQKLYTYKNITNIDVDNELASIDVDYKKDLETEHNKLQNEIDEIKQLISTTETSALLLDNLQKDVESEVE